MGLAFPAMGYSLIDGKTYRQINLKPTGFFQDSGGQPRTRSGQAMLRYTPPPKGSVCSVAENPGGQHAPQRNPSENIRGSASAVMACPYAAYGQLVLRNQRPSLGVSLLRNIQYEMYLSDLKERTKEKISNFILQERAELALGDSNRPDIRVINKQVGEWYEQFAHQLTPGKEMLGRIKQYIQSQLKLPPDEILKVSPALFSQAFQDIIYPMAAKREDVA